MVMLVAIAGWIVMAAALAGAVYAALSVRALARFAARPAPAPTHFPAVTLLKPLHGAARGLAENLETFCRQDYAGAVQIVFGVQDPRDPAIAVVEDLKARHPGLDIALSLGAPVAGGNPKIANLIAMFPHARHDVLVLSDCDMVAPADYLRQVVAALEAPGIGAVTCIFAGRSFGDLWSTISAVGIDYHFLPNILFAIEAKLAMPCFGSTIALTRPLLAELGGFEAFRHFLADDYEIGRAVRAAGLELAYPRMILAHSSTEASAGEVFRHELRWARTIRGLNAGGHLGSLVTHILPLGFVATLLLGFAQPALASLGAIVAVRLYQKRAVDRFLGRKGPSIYLLPLRDMLSFAVFVASFFVKQVDWRGSRYRVSGSGELAPE